MNGYLTQGQCERCEGRGETHGLDCLVRKVIFNWGKPKQRNKRSSKEALDAAIRAFEKARGRNKTTTL